MSRELVVAENKNENEEEEVVDSSDDGEGYDENGNDNESDDGSISTVVEPPTPGKGTGDWFDRAAGWFDAAMEGAKAVEEIEKAQTTVPPRSSVPAPTPTSAPGAETST